MTNAESEYRVARIAHWNRAAKRLEDPRRKRAFYHRLLERYYGMMIQPNLRVLELGCGAGDLLAALKPSFGVGIDFSPAMLKIARVKHPDCQFVLADVHDQVFESLKEEEPFDVIILSDLINDLWDVQATFERMHQFCHSRTRIIINFYSNLWMLPMFSYVMESRPIRS